MLTIGSLFSGVGGLELGLERAGLGPVIYQVEKEPFCLGVLAKNYPDTLRLPDIRTAHNLPHVDLICGGFPCQDLSSARSDARPGLLGSRSGLWSEFHRILRESNPEWVIVENVSSGADLWVDSVRSDLELAGYASLPVPLRADALGAPYARPRIFILGRRRMANPDRQSQSSRPVHAKMGRAPSPHRLPFGSIPRWLSPMPSMARMATRPARGVAQRAAGNCVVPAQAEVLGWIVRELLERG